MKESDEDLTAAEKSALAALSQDVAPPGDLEPRVLEALRTRGLLRASGAGVFRGGRVAAVACSAAILFGLGAWVGSRAWLPAASQKAPNRYLLLLEGPGDPAPQEEARRVEEYRRWARSVSAAGHAITGEKLRPEFVRLGPEIPAGGGAEVRGFFIIAAVNDQEALQIARGCPHLLHGGRIIVRPIDPT